MRFINTSGIYRKGYLKFTASLTPSFSIILKGNEVSFACDEFDEISIVVMNHREVDEGDIDRAREYVAEFIQFLKQNDVEVDWPKKRRRRR